MSSANFKGGLTPAGSSFAEKAKLQMRRPTPDSDAVASSDDDHDHVPMAARPAPANVYSTNRRPSTGWLQDIQPNRKFSLPSVSLAAPGSQPTTPSLELPQQGRPNTAAFPWNTTSFTTTQTGTRLKEVLPSPTSAQPAGVDKAFPSPTHPESEDGIGFLLNQGTPVRKSVRSQSYSIGQADIENSPVGQFSSRLRTSLRHRPSKPSLLGEGLSQLREDDLDDLESSNGSDQGVRLPAGYWERESKQVLLKQAAEQNARARYRAASTTSPNPSLPRKAPSSNLDYAVEEPEDQEHSIATANPGLMRRFSEHAASMGRASPSSMGRASESLVNAPWAASPGLPSNVSDQLGRRHSFATYTPHNQTFQPPTFSYNEEDEELASPLQPDESEENQLPFDASAYFTGYGPASRAINASAISAAHPDPIVPHAPSGVNNPYSVPAVLGRPGRRLFVVTFKCSRADVYYTYDNTGLEIRAGDLVITEGDRGCDLGQVSHADVSLEDAKKFKAEALDEHFRWLVMFSQYSLAGAKEPGMLGALARAHGFPNNLNRATLTSMGGQQDQDTKPKMIKRLAQQHEIQALRDKEGSEAKAKRMCAQKAVEHKLPMEILDAEFQADYHKLTFFYYAEAYVNFNDLVTDIFKHFKIRIWMSAVNPASVVNPVGNTPIQPPSAIGPGAILHPRTSAPAVGPGFGNAQYRQNNQQRGRGMNVSHGQYEDAYYPFAHQLAGFPAQPQYGMPQYSQYNQPNMYGRYDAYPLQHSGYPNVTASGSPMNYGAYYPPATYSASPAFNLASSAAGFRGGYPAATASYAPAFTGATVAAGYTTAGYGGNHSIYTTAPAYTSYGSTAGNGYGYTATSAGFDPALFAAMQNMSFHQK